MKRTGRKRLLLAMLAAWTWPFPALADEAPDKEEPIEDEVLVVTGTRTPRTIREAPVRTDVIGGPILEMAAPRNLADALEFLPGARAESNCQNCNTTEIMLLGLPGAYNQILFDGLPLVSGVAAVYGVEQIPALLVDRIEVVKGGGSALYGPGAVAGVINIIPRSPERNELRATAGVELPDGEAAWSASAVGSLLLGTDRGHASAYLHSERSPWVDLNGDGYSELARRRLTVAGVRGEWRPGEGTEIDFDYQFTSEDRRGGNRFDQPPHLANIAEAIDSRIHRASLSLRQELGEQTSVTAVYAGSWVTRSSFYGGLGDVETDPGAPGYDAAALADAIAVSSRQYGATDNALHFGELRLETVRGPHALLLGAQYRRESVDDRNLDAGGSLISVLTKDSFDTLGAFVQDEWTLSEAVRAVFGVRIDKSSTLADPVFSPRVGLWWSPSATLVLRANYSTGFRAPEVFSEDVHVDVLGADPVRVRNAPGLRQETARSFALGFDWRPVWNDGAFTLDGQAYSTTIENTFFLSEIQQDANGLFQVRSNAEGSKVIGAELNFSYRASSTLKLLAGGAWLRARYDTPQLIYDDGATVLFTRDYLKSPRWSGVGQVIWQPSPSLDGFLAFRYVGRMDALNNRTGTLVRTPDFLVTDVTLTRHFALGGNGDLDVTIGVKNLFDQRQKDLEVGPTRDSDYVYGPRAPRTLFVRANVTF